MDNVEYCDIDHCDCGECVINPNDVMAWTLFSTEAQYSSVFALPIPVGMLEVGFRAYQASRWGY